MTLLQLGRLAVVSMVTSQIGLGIRYRAEGWYIKTVPGAWIFSSETS